jgi:hypothetical protein
VFTGAIYYLLHNVACMFCFDRRQQKIAKVAIGRGGVATGPNKMFLLGLMVFWGFARHGSASSVVIRHVEVDEKQEIIIPLPIPSYENIVSISVPTAGGQIYTRGDDIVYQAFGFDSLSGDGEVAHDTFTVIWKQDGSEVPISGLISVEVKGVNDAPQALGNVKCDSQIMLGERGSCTASFFDPDRRDFTSSAARFTAGIMINRTNREGSMEPLSFQTRCVTFGRSEPGNSTVNVQCYIMPDAKSCSDRGSIFVTILIDDGYGGAARATSLDALTVRAPSPLLEARASDIAITLSREGRYSLNHDEILDIGIESIVTDVCDEGEDVTRDVSPRNFTCNDALVPQVPGIFTLSAWDGTSASAPFYAQVRDVTPPHLIMSSEVVNIELDERGLAYAGIESFLVHVSDECGYELEIRDTQSFSCANVGAQPIHVVARDPSGNSAEGVAALLVRAASLPSYSLPSSGVKDGQTVLGDLSPLLALRGAVLDEKCTIGSVARSVNNGMTWESIDLPELQIVDTSFSLKLPRRKRQLASLYSNICGGKLSIDLNVGIICESGTLCASMDSIACPDVGQNRLTVSSGARTERYSSAWDETSEDVWMAVVF